MKATGSYFKMPVAGIGDTAQVRLNPQAVEQIEQQFADRMQNAADYALAELQKRIPVRTGALRRSSGVQAEKGRILLYVQKYYGYFLERGWHTGSRRVARARAMRSEAKRLRQYRKLTGKDDLKAIEAELRREATKINKANAANRKAQPARPFLRPSAEASIPGIMERLAGRE
jgi:hypothetical protein